MESGFALFLFMWSHFLTANRYPLRLKMLYWEHTIRNDDDFARHVDYIHINPVKHGFVGRVVDWPYSSFHRFVRLGVYPPDWAGDITTEKPGGFGER